MSGDSRRRVLSRRIRRSLAASPRLKSLAAAAVTAVLLVQACVSRDVVSVEIARVIVRPGNASLVEGEQLPFEATVEGVNGRTINAAPVTWSSDDPGLLTVDSSGMVTAISSGRTRVTATLEGVSGSAEVEVIAGPSIRLTPDSVRLLVWSGGPVPDPVLVSIQNEGGRLLRGLDPQVSYPPDETIDWLTVSLSAPDAPSQMTLRALTDRLEPGRYSAEIAVTSPDDPDGPEILDVWLSLTDVSVEETAGGSQVTEAGSTDSVFVALRTAPDTAVVVDVSSADPGEVRARPATLTFTAANWAVPQIVVLTGQDEFVSDGDAVTAVLFAVDTARSDPAYSVVPPRSIAVTTQDDDEAGFVIRHTNESTVVSEAGTTDSIVVGLIGEALSDVVLTVVSGNTGEATVTPARLTFTPDNWDVVQYVTVTGVDDGPTVDGPQTTAITVAVDPVASDDAFDGLATQSLTAVTLDDDVASFTLSETDGSTSVSESGSTDSLTLVLDARPTGTVVFDVSSSDVGEVTTSPSQIVFDPLDWDQPRTVVVRGVDDALLDGAQTATVALVVNDALSADAYDGQSASVLVTNADDDQATLIVQEVGGTVVNEGGSTDQFSVVLGARPLSGSVVIGVTSLDTGEATVAPGTLTFTPSDWNVPQSVTVTGQDDDLPDGDQLTPVTIVVDDALSNDAFDGLADTVTVITRDDDVASILITEVGSTWVTESGAKPTDEFGVSLTAAPTSDVVLSLSTADPGEATLAAPSEPFDSLTFTPSDWNQTRTVTVTGVDDAIVDGDVVTTLTVAVDPDRSDAIYDTVPARTVYVETRDDDQAVLSIDDLTVVEANAGNAIFTVSLSVPSVDTITVSYATSDGTAVSPGDYTATSGTLTFVPGSTSRSISVFFGDDALDEADETFTVELTSPVNAILGDATGLGTIVDDDPSPLVSIDDVVVNEGDAGTTDAVFTVSLSTVSGRSVTLDYATSDGTAVAPGDYTATSGSLSFAPGTTTRTVAVSFADDLLDEVDETFTVELTNLVNATAGDVSGLGTIMDDDDAALSIGDATVVEGDAGSSNAVFTVTLSSANTQTVTVDFATADGTAGAPADYTATSGTLSFAPGTTSRTISVPVNGDLLDEVDETFTVTLSNPVNGTLGDATGIGIITDDDPEPSVSIDDVTVVEGDVGTTNATFTLSLDAPSGRPVTVNYATADGTAVAPGDYSATSGSVSFPAGTTSRTVTVAVNGDQIDEVDETFTVQLSSPVNAIPGDMTGVGTIIDDEDPVISIGDATVLEPDAGSVTAQFTVSLSTPHDQTVTVDYATSDGSAISPDDFTATSGTLSFAPGITSLTVGISVVGDVLDEADETFTVGLSNPVSGTLGDASGLGTITDNDPAPSVSIDDVTVLEGDAGTTNAVFTVTLSAASGRSVSVDYGTTDGSAVAPGDYQATSGTLTFPAGTATRTVTVAVNGDLVDELDETFTVELTGLVNVTAGDVIGIGTITDDEDPTLSISDVQVLEGQSGPVVAAFEVTLSSPFAQTVTVDYASTDATAVSPDDFTAVSGTLTFDPGTTSQTVSVDVIGDLLDESDETFTVDLANAVGVVISDGTGTGTITDDDATLSISDATVNEGNGGQRDMTFTVMLSAPLTRTVTVDYATTDGTAVAPDDYIATSGTLTFAPGTVSQPVTVSVIGDREVEGAFETFFVDLTNPVDVLIADSRGTGTINDNDSP